MCNEFVCASILKNANSLDKEYLECQIEKCETCIASKEVTENMLRTHKRVSFYHTQKSCDKIKSVVLL